MWKMMRTLLIFMLATFFLTAIANAGQTIYSDRAEFLANVSDATNYDFEEASGFPAADALITSFAGGFVETTTPGGSVAANIYESTINNYGFGQSLGGANSSGGVDNFLPVLLTFPQLHVIGGSNLRYAVGFDDLDLTGNGVNPTEYAIVTVTFVDGAPSQTYVVSDPDDDFTTAPFFGIISSNPIASIEVYSSNYPNGSGSARANYIDNFVLATPLDPDVDEILTDAPDNCPLNYNPNQSDQDSDGIGDVCDDCPTYPNPNDQACPGDLGSTDPGNAGTVVLAGTTAQACVEWNTLPDGQLEAILPDCNNVHFVFTDLEGNQLEDNCLYPVAYDVDDAVTLSPGDTYCVTCDISARFMPSAQVVVDGIEMVQAGPAVSGFVLDSAEYASYVTDPLSEKTIWTGQIELTASNDGPIIEWPSPEPIYALTPLSEEQLNATARDADGNILGGSFVYEPSSGAILSPGIHILKTSFTPSGGSESYTYAVQLQVNDVYGVTVLPPYAPPEEKAFKVKRAIPFQWQYTDTSGPVDSTDANPKFTVRGPYSCGEANDTSVDEEAISSGASGYQYDPLTYTWQYNWKTTGLSKDMCYDIYIRSTLTGDIGPFPILLK